MDISYQSSWCRELERKYNICGKSSCCQHLLRQSAGRCNMNDSDGYSAFKLCQTPRQRTCCSPSFDEERPLKYAHASIYDKFQYNEGYSKSSDECQTLRQRKVGISPGIDDEWPIKGCCSTFDDKCKNTPKTNVGCPVAEAKYTCTKQTKYCEPDELSKKCPTSRQRKVGFSPILEYSSCSEPDDLSDECPTPRQRKVAFSPVFNDDWPLKDGSCKGDGKCRNIQQTYLGCPKTVKENTGTKQTKSCGPDKCQNQINRPIKDGSCKGDGKCRNIQQTYVGCPEIVNEHTCTRHTKSCGPDKCQHQINRPTQTTEVAANQCEMTICTRNKQSISCGPDDYRHQMNRLTQTTELDRNQCGMAFQNIVQLSKSCGTEDDGSQASRPIQSTDVVANCKWQGLVVMLLCVNIAFGIYMINAYNFETLKNLIPHGKYLDKLHNFHGKHVNIKPCDISLEEGYNTYENDIEKSRGDFSTTCETHNQQLGQGKEQRSLYCDEKNPINDRCGYEITDEE